MATTKKLHLTSNEKQALLKDVNALLLKITKKKASITDSYERDFLEAARRATEIVKYNISTII